LPYPVIIESSQPLELISLSRNPPLRDRQKEKSFITHQIGIGVLIILWGLLYTGFWISSGFSGDDEKKGETDD